MKFKIYFLQGNTRRVLIFNILIIVHLFQKSFQQLSFDETFKFTVPNATYNISYSLANFGNVPYGKTLSGQIVLATPNSESCTSIDKVSATFLLSDRGGCSFTQKALQAQNSGAKLLIVTDNQQEDPQTIIMIEDGYGDLIYIPTILISKADGDIIKQSLEDYNSSSIAYLHFNVQEKKDNVRVEFYLNIESRETYKLLRDMQTTILGLGNKVTFVPHYQVDEFRNLFYTQEDIDFNCYSGGKYCMGDPDGFLMEGNGQTYLYEILRQICIFKSYPDKWWKFMEVFDSECIKATTYIECGDQLQGIIEIDNNTIFQCINDSIIQKDGVNLTGNIQIDLHSHDNTILQQELLLGEQIYYWPVISINGFEYRGNLLPEDIAEAICSELKNSENLIACSGYNQSSTSGFAPQDFEQFNNDTQERIQELKNEVIANISELKDNFSLKIQDQTQRTSDISTQFLELQNIVYEIQDKIKEFEKKLQSFNANESNSKNNISGVIEDTYGDKIDQLKSDIQNKMNDLNNAFNDKQKQLLRNYTDINDLRKEFENDKENQRKKQEAAQNNQQQQQNNNNNNQQPQQPYQIQKGDYPLFDQKLEEQSQYFVELIANSTLQIQDLLGKTQSQDSPEELKKQKMFFLCVLAFFIIVFLFFMCLLNRKIKLIKAQYLTLEEVNPSRRGGNYDI